jgi:hypothetical protein
MGVDDATNTTSDRFSRRHIRCGFRGADRRRNLARAWAGGSFPDSLAAGISN